MAQNVFFTNPRWCPSLLQNSCTQHTIVCVMWGASQNQMSNVTQWGTQHHKFWIQTSFNYCTSKLSDVIWLGKPNFKHFGCQNMNFKMSQDQERSPSIRNFGCQKQLPVTPANFQMSYNWRDLKNINCQIIGFCLLEIFSVLMQAQTKRKIPYRFACFWFSESHSPRHHQWICMVCCHSVVLIIVRSPSDICQLGEDVLLCLMSHISHSCSPKRGCWWFMVLPWDNWSTLSANVHKCMVSQERHPTFPRGCWWLMLLPWDNWSILFANEYKCVASQVRCPTLSHIPQSHPLQGILVVMVLPWDNWSTLSANKHKYWHLRQDILLCPILSILPSPISATAQGADLLLGSLERSLIPLYEFWKIKYLWQLSKQPDAKLLSNQSKSQVLLERETWSMVHGRYLKVICCAVLKECPYQLP